MPNARDVATAAVLALSPTAWAQLAPPPGHYSGTWTNTTFASSGPIKAEGVVSGSTVTLTIDPGGTVFGLFDPPPFVLTGTITGSGWNASITGHPVMGDLSVTVNNAGQVNVTGTNVPAAAITGYSATGTFTPAGVLNLAGQITFTSGPAASATITCSRTAYSGFASPAEVASGMYGQAVAGIGDITGDARGDLIVGAPRETQFGQAQGGRVHVYNGVGGALVRTLNSPATEVNGHFGWSVAAVPDADGDGRPDIVVGAPDEDPGTSPDGAGRAYLFSGATGALLFKLFPSPAEAGARFGWSVGGVADVNGDGRGDVIVGAPSEDPGTAPTDAGRVYVFSGATGVRLLKLAGPGSQAAEFFGFSVSGVADVSGDGRGDIAVGAPQSLDSVQTGRPGRALVFSGANGALLRTLPSSTAEPNGQFGWSVSGVPDLNQDGFGDVVVGAPEEDPATRPDGAGAVHVYSGLTGAFIRSLAMPTPTLGGHFGFSVSGMPDTDLDGRADLCIGAPGEGSADQGRAYIYSGGTGARLVTLVSRYIEAGGNFGACVGGVPTVNNNQLGDVIVGAPNEDPSISPANAGRAYLFRR